MPRTIFSEMPDEARVWAFGVGRNLLRKEESALLKTVDDFLDGWAAHGAPLLCARDFRHGRFLLVAVNESAASPSGCSIDSLVSVMRGLERHLATSIVDNTPIWFRDTQGVQRVGRGAFKALAETGHVSPSTTVFDNTVTSVGQVRRGEWERPAAESWHGRAFFKDTVRG